MENKIETLEELREALASDAPLEIKYRNQTSEWHSFDMDEFFITEVLNYDFRLKPKERIKYARIEQLKELIKESEEYLDHYKIKCELHEKEIKRMKSELQQLEGE